MIKAKKLFWLCKEMLDVEACTAGFILSVKFVGLLQLKYNGIKDLH